MWIWQQADWPDFYWQAAKIAPLLRQVYFYQGQLLGQLQGQGEAKTQKTLDTLLANIVYSSAIEGETLNAFSVRSSLARQLGVSDDKPYPTTAQTDGIAAMTVDAIQAWDAPLSLERLLTWHAWLFSGEAETSLFKPIRGGELRGEAPMQVVSGRLDRPKVHFEAPPRDVLEPALQQFIDWFNQSRHQTDLDPLVRAAITHLWFITLHPLEDGNGRIARLLTDLALAQAEHQSIHFYAMSVSIAARRKQYYDILEASQRGDLDITAWLIWFLDTLSDTLSNTLHSIERTLAKTQFWQQAKQAQLLPEQVKVLNRLLDGDFVQGINNKQYQAVAKVSRATATRHLVYLVDKGYLCKTDAGGRSTRYVINAEHSIGSFSSTH